MTTVESTISKLPLPKSNNYYYVLCLAVQEAVSLYPKFPNELSLEQLCARILPASGKSKSSSVHRSLERAVEYIWLHKEGNQTLLAIYEHPIVDKFSTKDFIVSTARYICRMPPESDSSGLWLTPTSTPFRYLSKNETPYFAIPYSHPFIQSLLSGFGGGEPQ